MVFGDVKALVIIWIVLLTQSQAFAQRKVYVSAGKSSSILLFNNDFNSQQFQDYSTKGLSEYLAFDVHIETRFNKVINGVTGISMMQVGYTNAFYSNDPVFGGFESQLKITNLGIPLLFRANILNAALFDVGFFVSIPIDATLAESRNIGTPYEESYEGKITSSLTTNYRGGMGGYLGLTILINRFFIAASWTANQYSVDQELQDTWPIGNGSMFLADLHPKFGYEMTHLKIGMRIK